MGLSFPQHLVRAADFYQVLIRGESCTFSCWLSDHLSQAAMRECHPETAWHRHRISGLTFGVVRAGEAASEG